MPFFVYVIESQTTGRRYVGHTDDLDRRVAEHNNAAHNPRKYTKNFKAEIDEELIEAYRGTVSLLFEPGGHKRVAVKIVDDRGIESLKIVEVG